MKRVGVIGNRSRLPIGVLRLLQRNHFIDRYVQDGGGAHRVWFEKGILIKKVRKQQIALEALWVGKRGPVPVDFILETSEGYLTDRECRQLGIGGVLCYKVMAGVANPKNNL